LLRKLDRLGRDDQLRLLEFARSLESGQPRGTSGKDLMHLAGILPKEDAEEMMRIIEEECEQVDPDGW
jgi:hypothetical protein